MQEAAFSRGQLWVARGHGWRGAGGDSHCGSRQVAKERSASKRAADHGKLQAAWRSFAIHRQTEHTFGWRATLERDRLCCGARETLLRRHHCKRMGAKLHTPLLVCRSCRVAVPCSVFRVPCSCSTHIRRLVQQINPPPPCSLVFYVPLLCIEHLSSSPDTCSKITSSERLGRV